MAEKLKDWLNSEGVKSLQETSSNDLMRFHFFRDECRSWNIDKDIIYSPADGVILYQKILKSKNEAIVEIKGKDYTIEEATDNMMDIEYPCIVIGIFMTAFDVHINRMPTSGILSHYHLSTISSYNKPMLAEENNLFDNTGKKDLQYLFNNERVLNRVYEPQLNLTYYFLQIADYDVRMIVPFETRQTRSMLQSERMGMIRWGSQCDLIIPFNKQYDFEFLQEEQMHVKGGYDPLIKIIRKSKSHRKSINTKYKQNTTIDNLVNNIESKNKKYIEAEDGEIILRNNAGDIVIIPSKDKEKVKKWIDDGDNESIDTYVSRLPSNSDYAVGGTTIKAEDTNITDENVNKIVKHKNDTAIATYKLNGQTIYPVEPTVYVKNHPEKYKKLEDQQVEGNNVYSEIYYTTDPPKNWEETFATSRLSKVLFHRNEDGTYTPQYNDHRLIKYTK